MKRTIVLIVLSLVTMTVVGALGDDDFSELTEFKGKMMESVASQVSSASDMTTTSGNRAIKPRQQSNNFKLTTDSMSRVLQMRKRWNCCIQMMRFQNR